MRAAVGLGSNVGDRLGHLRRAVEALGSLGEVEAVSSLYETEPVGGPDQGPFLNAVVILDTALEPPELLAALHRIEADAGRVRDVRWGPRTLDLDLLVVEGRVVEDDDLRIPHPRAAERRFVLAPLVEVWPEAPVGRGTTAAEALGGLRGQRVFRWSGDWRTGIPSLGWRGYGWVAAQLVLFVLFGAAMVWFGDPQPPPVLRILGGGLVAAAVVLGASATLVLGRSLTPLPQPRPGARFVARGAYRLARHPIYGAVVGGLVGLGLWDANPVAVLLGVAMAGFFWRKSIHEEANLVLAYPDYEDYRRRVRRRLIPWVW